MIAKIEKKFDAKFAIYDDKLKELKEPQEELKRSVEKHDDEILNLEITLKHNSGQIDQIDKNLEEIKIKIDSSEKLVEALKKEKAKQNETINLNIKQCVYYRRGYCREKEKCNFYHSNEICEIYLSNKVCWKEVCRKRHPKPYRYNQRGIFYRGESCQYLQK